MVELCVDRRGVQMEHTFLDDSTALLRFRLPLADIAVDFADRVKSLSEGFATFDYEPDDWQGPADVVRVDILVNGAPVDALASVCHAERAQRNGRAMVARLKDMLPKQSFEVAIQAVVRGRVVARESISALRKNVLAKCYGGDISRKKKLLSKQAEGKKRMKRLGSVDVPHEAFGELLKIT
jgi:translation factor GUF1, mitochondrial